MTSFEILVFSKIGLILAILFQKLQLASLMSPRKVAPVLLHHTMLRECIGEVASFMIDNFRGEVESEAQG